MIIFQWSRTIIQHVFRILVLMTTVFAVKVTVSKKLSQHFQLFLVLQRFNVKFLFKPKDL